MTKETKAMSNERYAFDASAFLSRIGVEDKLNAFLDSESVREVILAEYEAVKADVTAAIARLPESYRDKATKAIEEKLQNMDEEIFVEVVLCKLSEDVAHGLATLSKYLDIAPITKQLMDAVEEKNGLQTTLQVMAKELAVALKRNLKTALIKLLSDECESKEEFQNLMYAIFDGDEDAPIVIAVEGADSAAEALATVLVDCIFASSADSDEDEGGCQCGHEGENHCCGGCGGNCTCKNGSKDHDHCQCGGEGNCSCGH